MSLNPTHNTATRADEGEDQPRRDKQYFKQLEKQAWASQSEGDSSWKPPGWNSSDETELKASIGGQADFKWPKEIKEGLPVMRVNFQRDKVLETQN